MSGSSEPGKGSRQHSWRSARPTPRSGGKADRQTWKRSHLRPEDREHRAQASWLTAQRFLLSLAALLMVGLSVWLLLGVKRQVPLVAVFVRDYPTLLLPIASAAEDAAVLANLSRQERSVFDPGMARVVDVSDRCRGADAEVFVEELARSVAEMRPGGPRGDSVVLYVAAHGAVDAEGRACLLPPLCGGADGADAGPWVLLEDLLGRVREAVSAETNILVVLDACRPAGGEGLGLVEGGFPAAVDAALSARPPANCWVLLAASAGEVSRAEPVGEGSPFVRAFAAGLEGVADSRPWGDGNGRVELSELSAFVRDEVHAECMVHLGVSQTPCLFPRSGAGATDPSLSWAVRERTADAMAADGDPLPQNGEMADWLAERWRAAEQLALRAVHQRPLLWAQYRRKLLRCESLARAGSGWDAARTEAMAEVGRLEVALAEPLVARVGALPLVRLWTLAAPAERRADQRDAASLDAAQVGEADLGIDRWLAGIQEGGRSAPPAAAAVPLTDGRRWLLRAAAAWDALERAAGAGTRLSREALASWLDLVGAFPLANGIEPMEVHLVRLMLEALPSSAWSDDGGVVESVVRAQGLFGRGFLADDVRADRLLHATSAQSAFSRQRLAALDQFFVGDGRAVEIGAVAARDAEDSGRSAAAVGAELSAAWQLLDEVRADLPWLAVWFQRMSATVAPVDGDVAWEGAVAAVDDLQAALVGRNPESADRQLALVADLRPRVEALYRPIRSRHDDTVDALLQRSAANAATLAAVDAVLAVPLVGGERRNQLADLRVKLESQLRRVAVMRKQQSAEQEHDPRRALAAWTAWRGGRGYPLAVCLGAQVAAGREASTAATVADQIGAVAGGLRAGIGGMQRTLEALNAEGLRSSLASLQDAEMLVRRWGPMAVDDRFADDERSPVNRRLRLDWRDRFLRLADRILDDFLGPAAAGEPVWCLAAAEQCLQVAGLLVPDDDPSDAAAIARRCGVLRSADRPLIDVINQPDRFNVPADEAVNAAPVDTRLDPAEGVPRGTAAMWIGGSAAESGLLLRTVDTNEQVTRLAISGAENGAIRWRFDREALPRVAGRLGSVVDLSVFFRGHRHLREVPVAAAGAAIPIVWRRPEPVSPRVTVKGDVRQQESVALVFDCSGSMSRTLPNGLRRFNVGQEVLVSVLSQLAVAGNWNTSLWLYGHRTRWEKRGNSWEAALTAAGKQEREAAEQSGRTFSLQPGDDVGQMLPMQPLGQGQVQAVRTALSKLVPGGETPLYRAIQEVLQQDIQAIDPQSAARIVVITDGVNDQTEVTPTTAEQVERLLSQINERRGEPVKLEVIGFALEAEKPAERSRLEELKRLVVKANGRFIDAGDRDRLLAGLRDVLRLAEWQARGEDGDLRRADLGVPIEFPLPATGRGDRYQVTVDASLGGAESVVEVWGGERLELHLAGRGSRLEHRRYDGGSEQRIRDSQADLPDPVDDRRRWFVAAHLPRREAGRAVFPISVQNADAALFSPRPAEVWIEVRPIGVAAGRFLFQDATFENGRPVPVLDAAVPGWPGGADEAEILVWFTTSATPAAASLSLNDLPADREQPMELPGSLPVDLTVRRERDGERAWKLVVRETPRVQRDAAEAAVLVAVRPTPARVVRSMEPGGSWMHEFTLDDPEADWRLEIIDREVMQERAVGLKREDGRPVPLRVRMPDE